MRKQVRNNKGTLVGEIIAEPNKVYLIKKVIRSKHMLHKPPAWATDHDHLIELLNMAVSQQSVTGVEPDDAKIILEDDQQVRWEATVDQFYTRGFLIDRGFGPQQVLPEQHWQRFSMTSKPITTTNVESVQRKLF